MRIKYTNNSEDYLLHMNMRHYPAGSPGGIGGQFAPNPDRSDIINRTNPYNYRIDQIRKNRYQTEDVLRRSDNNGPLYSTTRLSYAGQKRLAAEESINNGKSRKNRLDQDAVEDVNRWIRDDYTNLENAVKSASELGKSLSTASTLFKVKPNARIDLSNMTDAELSAILNRERMERSYNELFNAPKENKGRDFVDGVGKFLTTTGGMALTGLQIAQVIRGFSGK